MKARATPSGIAAALLALAVLAGAPGFVLALLSEGLAGLTLTRADVVPTSGTDRATPPGSGQIVCRTAAVRVRLKTDRAAPERWSHERCPTRSAAITARVSPENRVLPIGQGVGEALLNLPPPARG